MFVFLFFYERTSKRFPYLFEVEKVALINIVKESKNFEEAIEKINQVKPNLTQENFCPQKNFLKSIEETFGGKNKRNLLKIYPLAFTFIKLHNLRFSVYTQLSSTSHNNH